MWLCRPACATPSPEPFTCNLQYSPHTFTHTDWTNTNAHPEIYRAHTTASALVSPLCVRGGAPPPGYSAVIAVRSAVRSTQYE